MFATDAILVTQNDTWHLPVKGAKVKAKAKAKAKAPGWHGNVKKLDALIHRTCPGTASHALRALRTSALRGRTLKSNLRMELHLPSTKLSTKGLICNLCGSTPLKCVNAR